MPSSSLENKLLQRYLFIMDYSVIRSNRKSLSIEVNSDAKVIVRAPSRVSEVFIAKFVEEKSNWINRAICKVKERQKSIGKVEQLSSKEINELADKALNIIPEKVKHYANIMGVSYNRITIRNQKTRWGSCSVKRNLNFNCLLMLVPNEVQNYVVVHELCHLKEMNHSVRFWAEVEKVMPKYREYKKWLKENGNYIISRI